MSKKNLRSFSVMRSPFLCLVGLLFSALPALADFSGKVIDVVDGDTITVWHHKRKEKVQLSGIQCPGRGQIFGREAKRFTSFMVMSRDVTVKVVGKDKHGRTLGDVVLPDGRVLNRELLKEGLAWRYRQDSSDRSLGELEELARAEKRGLWADPHPIPPWEWKKLRRQR